MLWLLKLRVCRFMFNTPPILSHSFLSVDNTVLQKVSLFNHFEIQEESTPFAKPTIEIEVKKDDRSPY